VLAGHAARVGEHRVQHGVDRGVAALGPGFEHLVLGENLIEDLAQQVSLGLGRVQAREVGPPLFASSTARGRAALSVPSLK